MDFTKLTILCSNIMDQEQILGTKTYIYNKHLSDREAEFSKHFFL